MVLLLACSATPEVGDKTGCFEQVWYADSDGDGYGADTVSACSAPAGYVATPGDCNDSDAEIHPAAVEACDGFDQDCDGDADEGLATFSVWRDADGDGWGDTGAAATVCVISAGWVENAEDCDDGDASIHPGGTEICNDLDDDCDGDTDEDVAEPPIWTEDLDGDGYGNPEVAVAACDAPRGWVADGTDCDDHDDTRSPGAVETCRDLVDQDCDGYSDDYTGDCEGDPGEVPALGCDGEPGDIAECAAGVAAFGPAGSFGTIQEALDAAVEGDTVAICPGTWFENLVVGVPVTLAGFGSDVSVINGAGGQILDMRYREPTSIVGIGLEDGGGTLGGGIYAYGEVCLQDVAVTDVTGPGGYAPLQVTGDSFTAVRVTVTGTTSGSYGAVSTDATAVTIVGSTFVECGGYYGSALYLSDPQQVVILGSEFRGNVTDSEGAIVLEGDEDSTGTILVADSRFAENESGRVGALSIATEGATHVEIAGCVFEDNTSRDGSGALSVGGGDGHTVDIVGTTFTGNRASNGGAIQYTAEGDGRLSIRGSTFTGNRSEADAGALYVDSPDAGDVTVTLDECVVTTNTAARECGGAEIRGFAWFESVNTDWGAGDSDNSPDDLCGYTWEGVADFTCHSGTCW